MKRKPAHFEEWFRVIVDYEAHHKQMSPYSASTEAFERAQADALKGEEPASTMINEYLRRRITR